VFQNFFKSIPRTGRRESGILGCEPWRGCREGWYFDRAEDIGWWWWWWRWRR